MDMRIVSLFATLALAAVVAGCGGNDAPAGGPAAGSTVPQSSGLGAGPGISIEEAIASDSDEMLLVNGNLLAEAGEVRLCSALAESFPPQCGGASLRVRGLKLKEVDGLITQADVSWTDRPIPLLGVVEDGTLTVSENVQT
jgi:hypothetical protein